MKEGCVSMGGDFSNKKCAHEGRIASCNNIVRNYHSPDVIYSTTYYQPIIVDASSIIDDSSKYLKETQLTCQNLGGSFRLP